MPRIAVYTLRIMGPDIADDQSPKDYDAQNQAVVDDIGAVLSAAEQLVSDALPEGYYAKLEDA